MGRSVMDDQINNKKEKSIIMRAMTNDKPLSVDEERLRSIIRAEMERFLFDQVCDDMKEKEDLGSGLDAFADNVSEIDEETMPEAAARRRKKLAKKREQYRKEIVRKQKQRHKCRQQRIKEDQSTYERWKELLEG